MALVCTSSSSKRKGKATSDNDPHGSFDPKRQKDWSVHETNILIDVVQQYQSTEGVVGVSFSNTVWSSLHKKFKEKIPDTICTSEKLKNRMKVLRDRFAICHELVDKRSGGSWDNLNQRPGAPSEEEYIEMVKAKGDKAKFLLPSSDPSKGSFPWYEQLFTMVGGPTSKGNVSKPSWNYEEDSSLPQWSARPSEHGSSDDRQGLPNDNEVNSPPRRSCSHPTSQSSGSKRKSTDESTGEGSSKKKNQGKSYRDRAKKKEDELHNLYIAGLEIASSIKEDTTLEQQQIEECITKMNEYGFDSGPAFDFMLREIESVSRRVWFLNRATKPMVTKWLNENKIFPDQSQAENNPFGFAALMSSNQGAPAYTNPPNFGGNHYGYPPHAHHPGGY